MSAGQHGERRDQPAAVTPVDPAAYPTWTSTLGAVLSSFFSYLLLAAAAVGDAVNFQSALGVVMEDQPLYVLRLAVAALTCAAVGLMHFAGMSAKKRSTKDAGPWAAISLTAIWLLLGLGLLALRVVGYESTSSGDGGFGAVGAATGNATQTWAHYALAALFFALYLATGAMASWAAFREHDPIRAAARRDARQQRHGERNSARWRRRVARRAVRSQRRAGRRAALLRWLAERRAAWRRWRAERSMDKCHRELALLEAALAHERSEAARDDKRLAAARSAINSWSDELREHSRQQICVVVGTPWATSALTGADESH